MKNIRVTQQYTNKHDLALSLFLKDISKIPVLSAEDEFKIASKARKGDKKALDLLITSNLRFVVTVAKQYQNKGLDLVDLIQEGTNGLIQAAERFDETRGFKFISYAVWWIRQSIILALSYQSRTIRIPMNQIININKINKAITQLEQKFDRDPSYEELEDETQISSDTISTAMTAYKRAVSLEMPFDDEETGSLLDVLPDHNLERTDEFLLEDELHNELNGVLNNLPYREQDIMRLSFGIGTALMQCEEIAARFGMCCERVRQIKDIAIESLKKDYLEELREILLKQ